MLFDVLYVERILNYWHLLNSSCRSSIKCPVAQSCFHKTLPFQSYRPAKEFLGSIAEILAKTNDLSFHFCVSLFFLKNWIFFIWFDEWNITCNWELRSLALKKQPQSSKLSPPGLVLVYLNPSCLPCSMSNFAVSFFGFVHGFCYV